MAIIVNYCACAIKIGMSNSLYPYCLVSDVLQILILAQQKCDHSLVDYTSSISLLPSF